jgi:hypothetical protein
MLLYKLSFVHFQCTQLVNSEGLNLLNLISKDMDPHRICTIIDVCPSNPVFKNVGLINYFKITNKDFLV